jgi:hypothetical protein
MCVRTRVVPTGLAHLFHCTRHFRAGLSYPAATRLEFFVVIAPPLAFNGSSHAGSKARVLSGLRRRGLKPRPFKTVRENRQ